MSIQKDSKPDQSADKPAPIKSSLLESVKKLQREEKRSHRFTVLVALTLVILLFVILWLI